jgi:glycosyltransferase involved in cell wall biosynthesis
MSDIIKVLHTEWSDGWGGQEIRIINEMILIQNKGIEVYLACRDHSTIKQKALESNIKTFVLPFRGNADLKTIFQLRKIILKNKITLINSHSGKDTWVAGIAAKLSGIKFIRTRHLSTPINNSRFNFINEFADYIFSTGESIRTSMIDSNRINPVKIKSIPTGVDCELFNPTRYDRKECRDILSLHDDEIVIGMVSVLRKFKRHDRFIKMIKNVINRNPKKKIKVFIAGKGPQEEKIKRLISVLNLNANIQLLGHVENVPQLLRALDIFILASDSGEGLSQSLMQALVMETAVISTNVGSTKDLYYDNNFVMIEVNNQKQMNDACDELVNRSDLRQKYQKVSRKYVMQHYSNEKMVEKITDVYYSLTKK